MNYLKKSLCLLLAAVFVVGLAACGGGNPDDTASHRPDFPVPEEKEEWVDTDGFFETENVKWAGPEGYVIVIPAGNAEARKSAVDLQDYFKSAANVTLQIVTDATAETEKEILIGKTKRKESNKDLPESDLQVSVVGSKVVIDGGHDVTVDSAVLKLIRTKPGKEEIATFKVTTDFSSVPVAEELENKEDYVYVWGDEFENEEVDNTKWSWHQHMSGSPMAIVSCDRDVIDNGDGRLKLRGIRYFDPEREGVQFKMPLSTTTKQHMNFVYGYCEIRARMPFFKGAWPSFWTQSTDVVSSQFGVTRTPNYFVEIDVFEVFGSPEGNVVPNIHKWYNSSYYDYATIHNKEGVTHTTWSYNGNKTTYWTSPTPETINQEYHTYGWEWTPKVMSMYVDGKITMTYDITKSFDDSKEMIGFHDPEFVMFNNHVTTTDQSYTVGLIEDNLEMLPSEYFIDYFRLYQKKGSGKVWIVDTLVEYPNRK